MSDERDEPRVDVFGPRWRAHCRDCRQSQSFDTEDDAQAWEHVCLPDEPSELVSMTVVVNRDFTADPKVTVHGTAISWRTLGEIASVVNDVQRGKWEDGGEWWRCVERGHRRRREAESEHLIEAMEEVARRPLECPGCKSRYAQRGWLYRHMRSCYRIDPAALRRGDFDELIGEQRKQAAS